MTDSTRDPYQTYKATEQSWVNLPKAGYSTSRHKRHARRRDQHTIHMALRAAMTAYSNALHRAAHQHQLDAQEAHKGCLIEQVPLSEQDTSDLITGDLAEGLPVRPEAGSLPNQQHYPCQRSG